MGKTTFRSKTNATTPIMNPMTPFGEIMNLLGYSALNLINPPYPDGKLVSAIFLEKQ